MTTLEKQLIVLLAHGIYIIHADGHRWIVSDRKETADFDLYYDFPNELKKHGVLLNNKVYGGVLQAIDIIDDCWIVMYRQSLVEYYDSTYFKDWDIDVDSNSEKYDIVEKGKGGLV